MIRMKIPVLCLLFLFPAVFAHAERKFIIGNQYDFSFGETNQGGFTSTQIQKSLAPFFGFYPSVNMKSTGHRTLLTLSYTSLIERFNGDQKLNSLAHVVNGDFAVKAGSRVRLDFAGSFSSAPDYTIVEVLQGVPSDPGNFKFVYQPSVGKSTMQVFRGAAGAEFDLNYRSYIAADFSSMALNFSQFNAVEGVFMDQRRQEGRLGYWYRLNPHQSIKAQYVVVENSYANFGNGRTQSAVIGYTRRFSPALEISIQAGPSYISFDRIQSYYGYVASAALTRKVRSSLIAAYYDHTPGDSSGLGTLSDMHSGGLSLFSPLARRLQIEASVSGFLGRGAVSSLNRYKGVYGTLDLAFALSQRWFLTWGGSYRLNVYDNPVNQEFKRLFVSIRFRAPDLWRTSL